MIINYLFLPQIELAYYILDIVISCLVLIIFFINYIEDNKLSEIVNSLFVESILCLCDHVETWHIITSYLFFSKKLTN